MRTSLQILSSLLLLAPFSTAASFSTSPAFHLLVVPRNASLPIQSFSGLHTGAGQNRLALQQRPDPASSSDLIFYQNATSGESSDATIVTDVLPQGFPLTIFLEPITQDENATASTQGYGVDLTVSGSTSDLTVTMARVPDVDIEVPLLSYPGATFLSCDNVTVGYLQGTWTVLNWDPEMYTTSVEGGEDAGEGETSSATCEVVDVVPVCDALPALPEGALVTHDFVQDVWCFDDEDGVNEIFSR